MCLKNKKSPYAQGIRNKGSQLVHGYKLVRIKDGQYISPAVHTSLKLGWNKSENPINQYAEDGEVVEKDFCHIFTSKERAMKRVLLHYGNLFNRTIKQVALLKVYYYGSELVAYNGKASHGAVPRYFINDWDNMLREKPMQESARFLSRNSKFSRYLGRANRLVI